MPANDPTGQPVPTSVLSTDTEREHLRRAEPVRSTAGRRRKDTHAIDHTTVNGNQLAPGHTYTWSGYLYVPTADTYTFATAAEPVAADDLNCPQTGENGTPAAEPDQPALTICCAVHGRKRVADEHDRPTRSRSRSTARS